MSTTTKLPPADELLTPKETRALFEERLKIGRSTYYATFKPYIPWQPAGFRRVRGTRNRYRDSLSRVTRAVALALVEIAAAGRWREYCDGTLRPERPELYPVD